MSRLISSANTISKFYFTVVLEILPESKDLGVGTPLGESIILIKVNMYIHMTSKHYDLNVKFIPFDVLFALLISLHIQLKALPRLANKIYIKMLGYNKITTKLGLSCANFRSSLAELNS